MSGSKRRTGYRKTLQDDVLHGLPEPTPAQCLALIARACGANLFEVHAEDGARGVALLPTRFRKLVWLKRGDVVILSAPSSGVLSTSEGAGAVTHIVEAILYEAALKHLRAIGRLPPALERMQLDIVSGGGSGGGGQDGVGSGGAGGAQAQDAEAAAGGSDEAASRGGGARRLQGPRGLPPPSAEDNEEEEMEEEVEKEEEKEEKEGQAHGTE